MRTPRFLLPLPLLALLLASCCLARIACAASFDCARASTAIERAVCATPALSALDSRLDKVYRRQLAHANAAEKSLLAREQARWLASLRETCKSASADCIQRYYESQLHELRLDCDAADGWAQRLACAADSPAALKSAYDSVTAAWLPYATLMAGHVNDGDQAAAKFQALQDSHYRFVNSRCLSLLCRRTMTAHLAEENRFPAAEYKLLLAWAAQYGEQTPLLRSDTWKLAYADATPVWTVRDGRIFDLDDTSVGTPLEASLGPALRATLPAAQAEQLLAALGKVSIWRMISREPRPGDLAGSLAGVSQELRASVYIERGGVGQCGPNPFLGSINVTPPGASPRSFNLIEIKARAESFATPTCARTDAVPPGFIPPDQDSYRSRIAIDQISGAYVRPDGTFWLKLADDYWYRFRPDMSSAAPEIGSRYHVMSNEAFSALYDSSPTLAAFERSMLALFATPATP